MDLRAKINSYYPSLTKSEQKVAKQVLDHADEVVFHSITELADVSGVGETTVIRFCRKIGFKGYQEFKLALAQDQTYKKIEAKEDAAEDFMEAVFKGTMDVLQVSMNLLDKTKLLEAVQLLDEARNVQFFGVGSSGISALDAKNRFLRIGRKSDAIADTHMQAMIAASMGEGDVAVGFSVSGSTKDTNDILLQAKNSGAKVIAITNYAKSPITAIADIVLLTAGKESPLEGGSITAKMSQLFMIELLCEGLALKDPTRARSMREKTARSVIERIY